MPLPIMSHHRSFIIHGSRLNNGWTFPVPLLEAMLRFMEHKVKKQFSSLQQFVSSIDSYQFRSYSYTYKPNTVYRILYIILLWLLHNIFYFNSFIPKTYWSHMSLCFLFFIYESYFLMIMVKCQRRSYVIFSQLCILRLSNKD